MEENHVCPLNPDLEKKGHYWLIDSPKGETSRGRCKYCNIEREFKNFSDDHWWDIYRGGEEGESSPLGRRAKINYF